MCALGMDRGEALIEGLRITSVPLGSVCPLVTETGKLIGQMTIKK